MAKSTVAPPIGAAWLKETVKVSEVKPASPSATEGSFIEIEISSSLKMVKVAPSVISILLDATTAGTRLLIEMRTVSLGSGVASAVGVIVNVSCSPAVPANDKV